MNSLNAGTILQAPIGLTISLIDAGSVEVRYGSEALIGPTELLQIIDIFRYPRTLADAVNLIPSAAGMAWIESTALIRDLYNQRLLVSHTDTAPKLAKVGFGAPSVHIRMLNDVSRTKALIKAINETVRPGDVVLDLGTGTGILALAAARQGAARVYAIESSAISAAAEAMFLHNGASEEITLLRGHSTRLELPERVDVMVSEIIGNDPLNERIREIFWDAHRRFLKPGARVIPGNVKIFANLVSVSDDIMKENTFTPDTTDSWGKLYGVDFSILCSAKRAPSQFFLDPKKLAHCVSLSDSICLVDVALSPPSWTSIDNVERGTISRGGVANGVVEYFVSHLSNAVEISNSPWWTDCSDHWWARLWLLSEELEVEAGDAFSFRYTRGGPSGEVDLAVEMLQN